MSKVINNFAGLNGFVWWMGVIENRKDPLKLGRCQVRIFGWHTENINLIPSDDLPWATTILSANTSERTKPPKEGDFVVGFFVDSESGQAPIIMGVLPGIPSEPAKPKTGFSDPRTQEQLNASPQPFGGSAKLYPNRLNEPNTSRIYRNESVDTTVIGRENATLTTNVKCADGTSWNQPKSSYGAVPPYNDVLETESGHVMEFDDTKGAERIHIAHRTGTFFEMRPDGSKVTKVVGKNYNIIVGDNFVDVDGTCNITVSGNVTLNVVGKVIAAAQEFDFTGPINVVGNINVEGYITSTGDVVAAGISLDNHTHPAVKSGPDSTGKPE